MKTFLKAHVSRFSPLFPRVMAVILAVGASSSYAAVEQVGVKLGGKQFGNGLAVQAGSGANVISKSKIYQYRVVGKVRGKKGAIKKAFPQAESLAKFIDSLQPGSSASLKGRYENPSAVLPVALMSKSVSGKRRIKGFGKVRITVALAASIDDKGQVVFDVKNVRISNKKGKLKGTMSFRAGKVVVHTAPVLSFKTNRQSVDENKGTVELIVVRDGYLGMAASVQFATSDSSALAGKDYEATTGVVTFAANEFEKAIQIPIIDNAVKDKPRQFNVILTAPSDGSVLGQSVTASVQIMNDDK